MKAAGFVIQTEEVDDPSAVARDLDVPADLQSCHIATVGGYTIVGHVPSDAVERLLAEEPPVAGIAVPGMPLGAPGMDVARAPSEPFDVIAYDSQGNEEVFASYP
jgi:hypothetical protein